MIQHIPNTKRQFVATHQFGRYWTKAPAIGWDAVKKDWQDGVFGFWAELKLSPKQAPQIHIDQGTAWTTGVVGVEGKNKSGQALSFTIIETQVYEKRGGRWLMVSHHASQVPE